MTGPYVCFRIDLDYVPWDEPDAAEFGHGEPAALLQLLDLARDCGVKLHAFASERTMRAFPHALDACLNEGHDVDWLCKHPAEFDPRCTVAEELLTARGVTLRGFALQEPWPERLAWSPREPLQFLSAPSGALEGLRPFPVTTEPVRNAIRSGQSLRQWAEATKRTLRDEAARRGGLTLVARPQVLARVDPRLSVMRELTMLVPTLGLQVRTLRELCSVD